MSIVENAKVRLLPHAGIYRPEAERMTRHMIRFHSLRERTITGFKIRETLLKTADGVIHATSPETVSVWLDGYEAGLAIGRTIHPH